MDGWTIEQRILFMGESNALLHLVEENLDREMYEVEIVDCKVEGVESIEELHPDLILLNLEGEDQQRRWNFLDAVKHHEATANIPVLLCADASQELQGQERNLQILNIQLLYKPFNKGEFLKALQQIVHPLASAFDAASTHKRHTSRLQSIIGQVVLFTRKWLAHRAPFAIAWPEQRSDGEALASSLHQPHVDLPDAEAQEKQPRVTGKLEGLWQAEGEQEKKGEQQEPSLQTAHVEEQEKKGEQQEVENKFEENKNTYETVSTTR
jgi:DNA-binding response OmpR family regulator